MKVLDCDSSSRTIVKSGVNYIFGIWSLPVGQVIVYRTDSVEDESKLYYIPIAGTSDPAIITYASAPEYNVTAVSYDRINDRWIITAISDLTETIDIIDRANPSTHSVLEPMAYNDFKTLLITVANPTGGLITIVSPYTAEDSGLDVEWVAYLLDEAGYEIGQLALTEVNSSPEYTRKLTPLENGTILIETNNCSFNVSASTESIPILSKTC